MRRYRQGDVCLEEVTVMPKGLTKRGDLIIVQGETTGHAHRFETELDDHVFLYENDRGQLWIKVNKSAHLVHEDHEAIMVQPGIYRCTPQREFPPRFRRSTLD